MAKTYKSQFLGIMRENERQMSVVFGSLANYAGGEVQRRAGEDGRVPIAVMFDLQEAIGERVTATFLGRVTRTERAPYRELPDGTLFPTSIYMRELWNGVQDAQRLAVEHHADLMTKRLAGAPDVLQGLRMATENPFANGRVAEQVNIVTNPLATYDPAHKWVDPRGYQLSDRIWRTSGITRRKIDMLLEDGIASGRSARDIARDLETFLQPGRTLRTVKPYGTDASYDAMRLARTEITRAHAQAQEMSAMMNPFVEGIGVRLSLSHPEVDICDEAAASSPFPKGNIPAIYQIPMHPHDLCTYYYTFAEKPGGVIDAMRAELRKAGRGILRFLGPVLVERFLRLLNGLRS